MNVLGTVVAGVLAVAALLFGGYYATAYFAPKYEAVRRDVMLQSRAYSEGEARNLYRLKIQFAGADSDAAKQTILLAARHECEAVDRSRLPFDLHSFCSPMGN